MMPTRRFGAIAASAGLVLLLAACAGAPYLPSQVPTAPPPTQDPATLAPTLEPLLGTVLVDRASAWPAEEVGSVTTTLVASFDDGARDAVVALAADGSLLMHRTPDGHLDRDIIVKPSEYAWFDGAFHPLGSTADLIPGDDVRGSFGEWTDDETTVWVESSSTQAGPYPWRIFAAGRDGGPALIASSNDDLSNPDLPWLPEPVAFGGRVYWQTNLAAGDPATGVWSAPVTGGPAVVELAGASHPTVTDLGIFATTTAPGPEGAAELAPGAYRVVRVDGDAKDKTLRTLDVGLGGSVGPLWGDGRWLATTFDLGDTGGIAVFNNRIGEGLTVGPFEQPHALSIAVCDTALVWMEPGSDGLADTIFRTAFPSGDMLSFDAPRAFSVIDCAGNDVLWSQSGDNGEVNQYVTTVG